MRRLSALSLFLALGLAATAAPAPQGFRIDVSAQGSLPLTWYEGGPALPHLGWGAGIGAEYDLARWIPLRFEASGFGASPSSISAGGELYRAWQGLRLAASTGYRLQALPSLFSARIGFLVGGAVTAARFAGTNLAFAYPSILADLRVDLSSSSEKGIWLGIPLEYMFRGDYASVSAGLVLGWRMGPLVQPAKAGKR
jgi:hypothetical protein